MRGPRDADERALLSKFESAHSAVRFDWFDVRDDEALNAALSGGDYTSCLFANVAAAADAAVVGDVDFRRLADGPVRVVLADDEAEVSREALLIFAGVWEAARSRRDVSQRRQVVAAAVLSGLFLAAAAGFLLY